MAINEYLIGDILNYIFGQTDTPYIVTFSSVCKLWYHIIAQQYIKCSTCNKIIKIYNTKLYETDDYCLLCHGHFLLTDTHQILNYRIGDAKIFHTVIKLLNISNHSYISIKMSGDMSIIQRSMDTCIEINMSKNANTLNTFTYHEPTIYFNAKQFSSNISNESETIILSVYGKNTLITNANLKINNNKSELLLFKCNHFMPCACDMNIITSIHDVNATIDSKHFNKICTSLNISQTKITWNDNQIIFTNDTSTFVCQCNNNAKKSGQIVCSSKKLLLFSKASLLNNTINIHFTEYYLIVITEIENLGKIKCLLWAIHG